MSKSLRETISDEFVEVEHQGETAEIDLPTWLVKLSNIDDYTIVKGWFNEKTESVQLALLQSALNQEIIKIRAKARPAVRIYKDLETYTTALKAVPADKKDWVMKDEGKLTLTYSIVSDEDGAQSRVDGYTPSPLKKPGETTKKTTKAIADAIAKRDEKMATILAANGMTKEQIAAFFEEAANK